MQVRRRHEQGLIGGQKVAELLLYDCCFVQRGASCACDSENCMDAIMLLYERIAEEKLIIIVECSRFFESEWEIQYEKGLLRSLKKEILSGEYVLLCHGGVKLRF